MIKPAYIHPRDRYDKKTMFAVFIRRKDDSEFIATSGQGPGLHHDRRSAHIERRLLKSHNLKGVVRPVVVTIHP